MSKIIQFSKQFFQFFDMFPATQFLRYRQSGDFKTVTGGFISVTILVIFIALFYSLGMQTINKEIITGDVTYINEVQPEPIEITFSKGSEFMFAVGIQYVDLSNTTKRFFNVSLRQHFYGPLLSGNNFTNIPLSPCTADHFSYNQDILDYFYKFNLNKSLCPPLESTFNVGGRLVSDIYSQFAVYIDYCNKSLDATCASDQQVLALQNFLGGFTVFAPIISTIINPGESTYKQVYIQQRNFYFFTTTSGLLLNGQIQQYQVETDVSLTPITDIQTQYITTIPNLFQMKPKPVSGGKYVKITFCKSGMSTTYTRSFNKIDTYLSYVGGLIGTLIMFFFILSSYSQASFLVSIASQLYKFQGKKKSPQKRYNFLYFISTSIKGLLSHLCIQPKWPQSTKFIDIIDQMQKQLDISFLIKRINFLDQVVSTILTQAQIKTLYLNRKLSLEQATSKRHQSNLPSSLAQEGKIIISQFAKQNQPQNHEKGDSFLSLSHDLSHEKIQSNLSGVIDSNSWRSSQKDEKQDIIHNIRQNLTQVLNQSKSGNPISGKIIEKVKKANLKTQQKLQNQQKRKQQKYKVQNKSFDKQEID